MLSVILYGRNDNHGYNLHKRAALSLNCIAEVLDAEGDEIVFVDWNTPDDFPTFPEAIRDTLTPRVARLLRILRVRPEAHARVRGTSRLAALEPMARNVAIRRTNPANPWVLSTNTDMIFLTREGRSLSEIVAGCAPGYHGLARYELPEALWESLDRRDAAGTLALVDRWSRAFHLQTRATVPVEEVLFDGCGDFQLAPRADLMAIGGFEEGMLLGWHVDSNLAKRMALLRGTMPGDLGAQVRGFHCDHTRQVTPLHAPGGTENDWQDWVTRQHVPQARHDMAAWGLAGEDIEEVRLDRPDVLVQVLGDLIPAPQTVVPRIHFSERWSGRIDYSVPRVLPFLLDALSSWRRDARLAWFGGRMDLLGAFLAGWRAMGFTAEVLLAAGGTCTGAVAEGARVATEAEILASADLLVFDFGWAGDAATAAFVGAALVAMAAHEQVRVRRPGVAPRRFMVVNSTGNLGEELVSRWISVARAPISTWVRQGFVLPEPVRLDLLARLEVGRAGERLADGSIRVRPRVRGHVCHGPYAPLLPGRWRATLWFAPHRPMRRPWHVGMLGPVKLEIVSRGRVLATRVVLLAGVRPVAVELAFEAPEDEVPMRGLELRVATVGGLSACVVGAVLERVPADAGS